MSEQNGKQMHSPGRLVFKPTEKQGSQYAGLLNTEGDEYFVAEITAGSQRGTDLANGERLAACWNACEQMGNPMEAIAMVREALESAEQVLITEGELRGDEDQEYQTCNQAIPALRKVEAALEMFQARNTGTDS